MDISSFLNNGARNLASYMFQGSGAKNSTAQIFDALQQQKAGSQSNAYVLDLSPEAQRVLEGMKEKGEGESSKTNAVIQNAKGHFLNFFIDGGIDLDRLSDDADEVIGKLMTFLHKSDATGRDTITDAMELKASNGKRDVYTLTGNNRRIRIAIEEGKDGQKMLTLTEINTNKADIAQISLEKDNDNQLHIVVERSLEAFSNGRRISQEKVDTLDVLAKAKEA